MGPEVIVVMPSGFHLLAGMGQRCEDRLVQALVSRASVEAFGKAVMVRTVVCFVMLLDGSIFAPMSDRHAGQLRAVAHWEAAFCWQPSP